jgi:D-methionine transport system permease protein
LCQSLSARSIFARLTESALDEVDYGRIEAVLSMGGNVWHIITKALLPEALPALLAATTLTVVMLIGFSRWPGLSAAAGWAT